MIDPAARLSDAAEWPLDRCLISRGWQSGEAVVVWVRRHPARAHYAVAVVEVDLAGAGLVEVRLSVGVSRARMWNQIEAVSAGLERCDPHLVAKVIRVGQDRAAALQVAAHPVGPALWTLMGQVDPAGCSVEIPHPAAVQALRVDRLTGRLERGLGLMRGLEIPDA